MHCTRATVYRGEIIRSISRTPKSAAPRRVIGRIRGVGLPVVVESTTGIGVSIRKSEKTGKGLVAHISLCPLTLTGCESVNGKKDDACGQRYGIHGDA
jgi:hypothetical protein